MLHAPFGHIVELVGDEGVCVQLYLSNLRIFKNKSKNKLQKKVTSVINLDERQASARCLCSHAGKRASSPVFIQAEDVDDTGGKGNKNEMKDLEDRLVHSFTPGFPWGAFEAAAKQLKVTTCIRLPLACPRRTLALVKC